MMMHENSRPIGVFDSGLGGLSAVREIRTLLPHEELVYFGDTGRVPYGTRSRDTIRRYAAQDIRFLLSQGFQLPPAAVQFAASAGRQQISAVGTDVKFNSFHISALLWAWCQVSLQQADQADTEGL